MDEATYGVLPPAVSVANCGRLGFPLCPEQAASLIKEADRAPYGRNMDTLIDEEVRRAWQIGKDKVMIADAFVVKTLPALVKVACHAMGLDADALGVEAHFYKMLLYEQGGHFKKHQDTEKEPGMFGSLLVQLPATHEGGDLVVEHAGKVARFAHSGADSGDHCYFSAFFCRL